MLARGLIGSFLLVYCFDFCCSDCHPRNLREQVILLFYFYNNYTFILFSNNYLNHFEKQNPVCNDEDDPQGGDSIYENDEFEIHNKLSLNQVIVGG